MIRLATEAEELGLIEKRMKNAHFFDALPRLDASIEDLNEAVIKLIYLPSAIHKDTLATTQLTWQQQLASLRFKIQLSNKRGCATFWYESLVFHAWGLHSVRKNGQYRANFG
jgi:hypothetical protein